MPAKKKGAMKQALSTDEIDQLRTGSSGPALNAPVEQTIEVKQATPQEPTLSSEAQLLIMQAKQAQTKLSSVGAIDVGSYENASIPPPDKTYLEVDGMPSGGSFYKTQVYGQPLKVQDLLLIQSVDEKNVTSRFDQIFNRRLWGIKPGEILTIDEMFFALWLRATSFEGYDFPAMPFQCTSCNYESKPDEAFFNWGDISWNVNNIENTFKLHESGAHEVVLPKSQVSVKIHLRRRKHMNIVNELIKRDFWNYGKEPSDEYYELLVMCSILDLGASDLKETAAYIQELPAMDFITLINEINNASVDAEPVINVKCPRCQEENPVTGYPFRPDIYLPTNT